VYGVLVNTNSSAFTAAEKAGQGTTTASLSLGRQTIGAILQGNQTNWNDVPDSSGNAVTSASLPITIVNREQGAGVRVASDIYFTGDHCTTPLQTPIQESTGGTADYFSMGNVLAAANTIPGAITYATIDYAGSSSYPNLTLVAVDGVQPSNLNAAAGIYGDWFESQVTTGSNYSSLSADQQALIQSLITAFQTESTAPGSTAVLANPNYNTPSYPVSGTAVTISGATIYTNPYSRIGNSCNDPLPFL
jgi:ABC-type phosphate transport system substrate-binding protein